METKNRSAAYFVIAGVVTLLLSIILESSFQKPIGDTWLDILKTPPRGNAYLILAHQYIAAQLNVISLAGETSFAQSLTATNVSSIDLIVDHARSLCEINTANSALLNTSNSDSEGLELELVRSGVRQDFINTAFVLDEFNNALSEAREALDD